MVEKNNVKTIDDLTFGDEYLFEEVMQNKELCKQFIEIFLEIPNITEIEYISAEKSYKDSYWSKGVRFDIYVKGQDGVAYVVELQREDTKEIDKRFRYYQSVVDSKLLPKGKKHTYKNLKDSYIIFISREDLYGKGRYRYSFRNICEEDTDLKLDDGAYKIVFNAKGNHGDVSEDVKAFLKAIEGMESDNSFVKRFEAFAEEVKADETWRKRYMQSLLRDQDKFDAGVERGIEQGKIEIVRNLLATNVSKEIIANASGLTLEEVEALAKEIELD